MHVKTRSHDTLNVLPTWPRLAWKVVRSAFIGSGPTLWTIVHATVLVEEFPFLPGSLHHTSPFLTLFPKRGVVKNPQERRPAGTARAETREPQGTRKGP